MTQLQQFRYFRHTCTSVRHQFSASDPLDSATRKSNISRRTSSGRMSIVVRSTIEPISCCCSILGRKKEKKKKYVYFVLVVCSETRNVLRSLQFVTQSRASYLPAALLTQGSHEMMVSRGLGMLGCKISPWHSATRRGNTRRVLEMCMLAPSFYLFLSTLSPFLPSGSTATATRQSGAGLVVGGFCHSSGPLFPSAAAVLIEPKYQMRYSCPTMSPNFTVLNFSH